MNKHVRRKRLDEAGRRVLIRCDGGADLGLGHVYRSLALAEQLRDEHSAAVLFALAEDDIGEEVLRRAEFPVQRKPSDSGEQAWLAGVLREFEPDALILDIRNALPREFVAGLRAHAFVAAIDDPSDRRLAADAAFYPPVPQVGRLDWSGFAGKLHVGWECLVLRREFLEGRRTSAAGQPHIVVMMGAADPPKLTPRIVEALDASPGDFRITAIVGAAYGDSRPLEALAAAGRHRIELLKDVANPAQLMRRADLAVVAMGMSAFEFAALGVPCVYACFTPDHAIGAGALTSAGMGVMGGVLPELDPPAIAAAAARLVVDRERLAAMSRSTMPLYLGLQQRFVAAAIMNAATARNAAGANG